MLRNYTLRLIANLRPVVGEEELQQQCITKTTKSFKIFDFKGHLSRVPPLFFLMASERGEVLKKKSINHIIISAGQAEVILLE